MALFYSAQNLLMIFLISFVIQQISHNLLKSYTALLPYFSYTLLLDHLFYDILVFGQLYQLLQLDWLIFKCREFALLDYLLEKLLLLLFKGSLWFDKINSIVLYDLAQNLTDCLVLL